MTNKLTLVKKTQKHTKETKLKPTGPSSPVISAHTSVHLTEYNCGT